MINNDEIILVPSCRIFLTEHLYACMLLFVGVCMVGLENPDLKLAGVVAGLAAGAHLLWKICYYTTVKWVISDTQIKACSGVFTRSVSYIELYRINDFAEEQGLMQQILGIKDVYIMSTDRSHPVLCIYGIPASLDIIAAVKPLVKTCKKENQIYEIANH